jgi:bacterioferritin (cytochrome b1)
MRHLQPLVERIAILADLPDIRALGLVDARC